MMLRLVVLAWLAVASLSEPPSSSIARPPAAPTVRSGDPALTPAPVHALPSAPPRPPPSVGQSSPLRRPRSCSEHCHTPGDATRARGPGGLGALPAWSSAVAWALGLALGLVWVRGRDVTRFRFGWQGRGPRGPQSWAMATAADEHRAPNDAAGPGTAGAGDTVSIGLRLREAGIIASVDSPLLGVVAQLAAETPEADVVALVRATLAYRLNAALDTDPAAIALRSDDLRGVVTAVVRSYDEGGMPDPRDAAFAGRYAAWVEGLGRVTGREGARLLPHVRLALTGATSGPSVPLQLCALALATDAGVPGVVPLSDRMAVLRGKTEGVTRRRALIASGVGGLYVWQLTGLVQRVRRGEPEAFTQRVAETLRDATAGAGVHNVLEIGIGAKAPNLRKGYYPRGIRLYGVDPSPPEGKRLREAEAAVRQYELEGLALRKGVAEHLTEFPDGFFDAVVCTLTFCSVDDPEQVRGCRAVFRKWKGVFFFLTQIGQAPTSRTTAVY